MVTTSSNNVIYTNNIWNGGSGIRISSSPYTKIIGNNLTEDAIWMQGNQLSDYNTHHIPEDNLVNGKPVYYYKNLSGMDIDGIAVGQIIVANCTVFNFSNLDIDNTDYGIQLAYSSCINIDENSFSWISIAILAMRGTSWINITNNDMDYVGYGARFEYSSYNKISSNNFTNSGYPIDVVWSSNYNYIQNNNLTSCSYAIDIAGSSYHTTVINNYFYDNHVGTWIRSSSRYNMVKNNTFLMNDEGVLVQSSQHNKIEYNNISNSIDGGITLENTENITILNNNISMNNGWGISFDYSLKSPVSNNYIFNHDKGIMLVGNSYDNLLMNNIIINNTLGVHLDSSPNNQIIDNNVSGNLYGINITSSSDNWIFHNNIIDNTDQANDDGLDNYWDDGYPSGGNYWSDYGGIDLNRTPNQDVPPPDGIGDTPHVIDVDSLDCYPLMEPYFFKPFENFTLLREGWNLISIPLIQEDKNLDKVLEMIDGYYDAVRVYDSSDPADPWKQIKLDKPFGNDLTELDETMGIWIHMTRPGDTLFLYDGTTPITSQGIQLNKGWNLVGYPSLSSQNRTDGLNNTIFGTHINKIMWYDATSMTWHSMEETDYFLPGRGYWIHSKTDIVWQVPL
jgi:parallel beta-helix repeat protein